MIWLVLYIVGVLVCFSIIHLQDHKTRVLRNLERGFPPPSFYIEHSEAVFVMSLIWPILLPIYLAVILIGPLIEKLTNAYTAHLVKKHSKKQDNPEL